MAVGFTPSVVRLEVLATFSLLLLLFAFRFFCAKHLHLNLSTRKENKKKKKKISTSPLPIRLKIPRSRDVSRILRHGQTATPTIARRVTKSPRTAAGSVNGTAHIISMRLGVHGHLIILRANRGPKAVLLVARADRGQKVDDETPDVEDVDERDDPFQNGGGVDAAVAALHDAEGDGEGELDDDEEQLHPEGDAQDAEFAPADAETLVFGADEDGGDDVAGAGGGQSLEVVEGRRPIGEDLHEQSQHSLMGSRVTSRIKDSQQNQTDATGHGEQNRERRKNLLRLAVIHGQAAFMSEPALGDEDRVEKHHHDRGARDEQRFAPGRRAEG